MIYTPLMKINTMTDVVVINSSDNKVTGIDTGISSNLPKTNTPNTENENHSIMKIILLQKLFLLRVSFSFEHF